MKKSVNITLSVLGYIIFFAMWLFIGFAGFFMLAFDFNEIVPRAIKVIFIIVGAGVAALPIYLKLPHPKRIFVAIIITLVFISGYEMIFYGIKGYYSSFTQEKWLRHENYRHLMIDSLESQYALEGMTGDEVIELLGEPDYAQAGYNVKNVPSQYFYEYYAGDGFMDPIIYRVIFENGIVVNVSMIHT